MSALRGSRNAAAENALMAAAQSFHSIAFLPAAKSESRSAAVESSSVSTAGAAGANSARVAARSSITGLILLVLAIAREVLVTAGEYTPAVRTRIAVEKQLRRHRRHANAMAA